MKTKIIIVSVTKDDIAKGRRRDHQRCAFAIAAKRVVPNHEVSVSTRGIILLKKNTRFRTTLNKKMTKFQSRKLHKNARFMAFFTIRLGKWIRNFDRGARVQPVAVILELEEMAR